MQALIWHNPKCSTSRKALEILRARGIAPSIVLYLENPPGVQEIKAVLREAGLSARELLRRRGTPYEELGLDDPQLSEADLIAAMAKHPILIERPLVRTEKGTRLCRPLERIEEILSP